MLAHTLNSTLSAAEIDARMQLWLIRTAPEQDFRQGLQIHGTCVNNCFELDFYYHYEVETIRYDGPYRVTGKVMEDNQTTLVTYRVLPDINRVSFLTTIGLLTALSFATHFLTDAGIVNSIMLSVVITLVLCAVFVYPNYIATCKAVEEILSKR